MASPSAVAQLHVRLRTKPLETRRLRLRLPRAADASAIFEGYATDREAIRWMGFRPHESIAITQRIVVDWCANWRRGEGMLAFIVEDRMTTGEFLGVVDLTIGPHGGLLGYILCRHAWGRGIATEAARCIVDLAFRQSGLWRVWATCAPQNHASRRVLEKVGMRHEGVLKRWIVSPLVSDEPRDSDCMAITLDDWLAVTSSSASHHRYHGALSSGY